MFTDFNILSLFADGNASKTLKCCIILREWNDNGMAGDIYCTQEPVGVGLGLPLAPHINSLDILLYTVSHVLLTVGLYHHSISLCLFRMM